MPGLFDDADRRPTEPMPVSALAARIADAVAGIPGPLRVTGEVSNLNARGHWYFTLKDASAAVSCVMWQSRAAALRFVPRDGQQVVASGRVDYWTQGGRLNFVVERLEAAGQGALELELRRRIEHYRALGWFDEAAKKPLPAVPRGVAVVTSRSGAALQDVRATAARRWPACPLFLCDVRVQGAEAKGGIARMLRLLGRDGPRLGVEVVILTRGGGSLEDLWAFNEPEVAEAVRACPLPVVAAIGHETDTTLAELVADLRCSTPTQAAMAVVPEAAALRQRFEPAARRLLVHGERELRTGRQRLAALARAPFLRDPAAALPPARRRLAEAGERLREAAERGMQRRRERLAALERHLAAVDPARVLERGFSLTFTEAGELLRRPADAPSGSRLRTRLSGGEVASRVEGNASLQ